MLLFVLLIGQLIGADGKAYLFTCPAYPRLESGVAIHGVPVIEDALRQLVVRRGGTSLSTGDLYEPGELLLITLNDTSGDADIIFETNCSTCTFKFGICPGKYRFIGRVASVNMPTDFSNFTVWGAYAVSDGVVRIAPPIHLRPRVPDPTMAPTFANPPTISPTQISAARHSILIDVRYDGMSKSAVINNSDAISDAICSHMDYRGERCKLIAALNDQSGDTVVPASLWSTVSDILDGAIRKRFRFIRPTRELTPNAKSIGTIIVDGFMYPEWQQPAIRSISEYINTAGSGGYTEALRALVGMGDLIGTTVLRARIVNNTDSALFAHSCSIDESLALFWALDTARPARFVRGLLQIGGTHWVAGGVVGDDVRAMVTDPNNVVFLFNAETDRSFIYELSSYLAKELEPDTRFREFTRVVTVSKEAGMTSLQFEQQQYTGIEGDPELNLEGIMASNHFIWAYGNHFQHGHKPNTRGIIKVNWNQGTCSPVEVTESMFPYLLLAYGTAALVVLVTIVTMSPAKHSKVAHYLKFSRVQAITTRFKNRCRKYDHFWIQENEVKAIPTKQLLYNEILNTSIGAFLVTCIMTGIMLAFGYFIYVDRLINFKLDPIRCYSIALAYMGSMSLGISLLTATKTKLWQFLINVSIDRAIKFHKYASASAVIFLMGHTGLEIWFWGVPLMINLDYSLIVGRARPLFGFTGMCCFLLVSFTSLPAFRNRYYHRFLGMHSWFLPGVIFSILHYVDMNLLILGPGLILYLIDLFLRHLYSWLEPKVVARRLIGYEYIEMDIQFHNIYFFYEKNAVRLKSVSTQFLTPAAWYYVCVPEIKSNEWHPLTVVGFSGNKIKFVVRRRNDGGWSENLYTRIFADLPISVKMRGPYGSLMIDIYNPKYKDLIFIAGGVGAAVVQSMIEALIFYYMNYTTEDGFVPSIKLVIVSQNRSLYEFINKRLEYYSTCKRPRITLDLYWTSKFMKYLEADKTKEVLTVTDNQLSSKPSETPFELLTENILKPADINAEEKTYEPVDGYVSDSYKALVSKPVVFKPAVSSTITTQAVTPNVLSELKSLETEDKNDNIEMSKSSSKKSKRKNADASTESTTTPNNRPASADDRPSKNLKKHKKLAEKPQGVIDAVISSRINQSKEQSEKNTPRLNSESIENVDMTTDVKGNPDITGSLDVAAGNPSSKTKNAKKSKKKNDEVCHDSRLQNCSVDSPGDVFSLSSDKTGSTMRSKKKGSRKYDEDDDNFRIDADSLDSIAVSTLKASPSKKSKSSSQKNTRNITIDDDDSVFMEDNFSDFVLSLEQETSVSTPVVNPSESKSKKPSSRKGNRKSDVIDANDGNANLVAASESLLTVETNVGTASERLFTPSRKSPNTIDEERPLQLNEGSLMDDGTWDSGAVLRPTPGSPVNSAVAFTTPGSEERFSSKHISFGPVPEPPKSRLEDFIVYEHFYENILKRGRPNVEDIILNGINGEFSSGARGHHDGDGMFSNQAVIVCAPPSLIAATRAVCSMYNIDMHDQVFDYN